MKDPQVQLAKLDLQDLADPLVLMDPPGRRDRLVQQALLAREARGVILVPLATKDQLDLQDHLDLRAQEENVGTWDLVAQKDQLDQQDPQDPQVHAEIQVQPVPRDPPVLLEILALQDLPASVVIQDPLVPQDQQVPQAPLPKEVLQGHQDQAAPQVKKGLQDPPARQDQLDLGATVEKQEKQVNLVQRAQAGLLDQADHLDLQEYREKLETKDQMDPPVLLDLQVPEEIQDL